MTRPLGSDVVVISPDKRWQGRIVGFSYGIGMYDVRVDEGTLFYVPAEFIYDSNNGERE